MGNFEQPVKSPQKNSGFFPLVRRAAERVISALRQHLIYFIFPLESAVSFFLEILGVSYLASFVWFWSLCRAASRRKDQLETPPEVKSNLIPFERGLEAQVRRARAM